MWFLTTLKPKTPQQRKLGHWGPELPRLPLAPTPKADVPHQKSGQNQPKFLPKKLQDDPMWLKDDPKYPQDGQRWPKDDPKWHNNDSGLPKRKLFLR